VNRPRLRACGRAVVVVIVLVALIGGSANADLGVGIDILPTQDETPGSLSANRELWFSVAPGGSATRALRIVSASDSGQLVSMRLYPLVVSDGEERMDTSTPSETANWAAIVPNDFILEPRSSRDIVFTYRPPRDVAAGTYEAYLSIQVSAESIDDAFAQPGTKAVVPTSLNFKKAVWLGVGDGTELRTDFELRGLAGYRKDSKNLLQVRIENTGQTPIRPKGDVQIVDPLFPENRFGPLDFSSPNIGPGETMRVDIDAPEGLEEGRWRAFVRARQGSIEKSAIYDVDLTFDDSTEEYVNGWRRILGIPWLRFAIPLIALLGVLLGWKLMRSKPEDDSPSGTSSSDAAPSAGGIGKVAELSLSNEDSGVSGDTERASDVSRTITAGESSVETPTPGTVARPTRNRIVVHVSGAVRNPGMFEVDDDARVGEVIELAGGMLIIADSESVNLARRVEDGEQIVVPKRVVTPRDSRPMAIPNVLDLNLASAEQLAALPGVGRDLGAEIVAYRRRIGKFTSVEQLLEVKGIGPRKFGAIRRRLRI